MQEPHLHVLRPDTDDPLVRQRFLEGDTAAFDALVHPHLDTLYTLCLRMVGSPSDAEDLAQEALLRALNRRSTYRPERPFRPWLLAIATNVCRDHLRSRWWRRLLPLNAIEAVTPSPDAILLSADRDQKLRAALQTLERRYREAMALYYLDDMSYAEMSEITGDSVAALKQRIRRGNEMLRRSIERMYPEFFADRTDLRSP